MLRARGPSSTVAGHSAALVYRPHLLGTSYVPFQIPPMLGARVRVISDDSALEMCYIPDFLSNPVADALLERLRNEVQWSGERVHVFGRWHAVPRLVSWCGEPRIDYRYSGRAHRCHGWSEPVLPVRRRLLEALGVRFNFVLLNRYRDGADAMGWHADDEPSLGRKPVIASISLGATRRLLVRARRPERKPSTAVDLHHGSLLLAWGNCQHRYEHSLARTRKPVGERINLTFRNVISSHG